MYVAVDEARLHSNAAMERSESLSICDRREAAEATSEPSISMDSDSSSTSTMPVGVNEMGCSGLAARTSPMRWRRRDDESHAVRTATTMPTTMEATNTFRRFSDSRWTAENSSSSRSSPTSTQCSEANGDVLS